MSKADGFDSCQSHLARLSLEMDLTKAAPFTSSRLAATKRELKNRGLAIPCLDTSCRFDEAAQIGDNIDDAKRHIDLANALDAPYIRVFGDRIPDGQSHEKIIEQVTEGLLTLACYAEGTGVQVLLESHGDFARVRNLLDVLQAIHHPQVGVLWDVHHPQYLIIYGKYPMAIRSVFEVNSIILPYLLPYQNIASNRRSSRAERTVRRLTRG